MWTAAAILSPLLGKQDSWGKVCTISWATHEHVIPHSALLFPIVSNVLNMDAKDVELEQHGRGPAKNLYKLQCISYFLPPINAKLVSFDSYWTTLHNWVLAHSDRWRCSPLYTESKFLLGQPLYLTYILNSLQLNDEKCLNSTREPGYETNPS